jgi:hypothetical protein
MVLQILVENATYRDLDPETPNNRKSGSLDELVTSFPVFNPAVNFVCSLLTHRRKHPEFDKQVEKCILMYLLLMFSIDENGNIVQKVYCLLNSMNSTYIINNYIVRCAVIWN